MSAYKKIVVGTDGSPTSLRALDRAAALAADNHAELVIVTAYEPQSRDGSGPSDVLLGEATTRARSGGASDVESLAVPGAPVEVLDRVVDETGADLLVIGNVGLNSLTGRILGSVPQNVARRAGVDVLIVHTS